MADPKYLLTVAIPTYNRSRYLARLLKSIVPQIASYPEVQLIISDNASSDDTSAVVDVFRDQGVDFSHYRNPTNVGLDENVAQCFNKASGKYLWIIGDDDVIAAGALSVVIKLLENEEVDIVRLLDRNIDSEGIPQPITHSPKIEIINDAETFALRNHVNLTFLTGNIINRERVLVLPHGLFSSLVGTSLGHMGWTFTALRYFRRGAIILDPLVGASSDDRGGYGVYTVFGKNLKEIADAWLVEPSLIRIIMNGTVQIFFPTLVMHSRLRQGNFVSEQPDLLMRSAFSANFRYFLFIYPITSLPVPLARVWWLAGRLVNRIDKALGHPMLR